MVAVRPPPPPQVLALLVSEAVGAQVLPKAVPEVVLLVRLLQLAVECRTMMRDRAYRWGGRRGGGAGRGVGLPACLGGPRGAQVPLQCIVGGVRR